MPTNFPTSLDTLTNPAPTNATNAPSHSGQHSDANDAIEALEAKVGVNTSAVTSSLDFKSRNHTHTLTTHATFAKQGAIAVATGGLRFYVNDAWTITNVRTSVGTAPTGAAIRVDVNRNGTSIWATNQANRPNIAVGLNSSSVTTFDTSALSAGDFLSVDIDQVGSTVAGSDLVVTVWLARTPTPN